MTQRIRNKAAAPGDHFLDAYTTVTSVQDCDDVSQETQKETTESRLEVADRQAIERGEDEGMRVDQSVASSAYNRGDFNAIAER